MITLIVGRKGSGKTKKLIERAVQAVKSTNGKELVDELSFTTCALQRPQTPADMGYAALFLASEQADNITGVMLDVAGGYKL